MNYCTVISVYNGSSYIIEQLDSLLQQSVKPSLVIIADDCSTDNSFELMKRYIAQNHLIKWKLYKNIVNLGWKKSFANLITKVPEWIDTIFLCDQDDIWHFDKAQKMLQIMDDNVNVKLAVSEFKVIYEEKGIHKSHFKRIKAKGVSNIPRDPKYIDICYPGCTMAVRRSFAQKIFNLPQYNYVFPHDQYIWIMAYAENGIYHTNDCLMDYRRFRASTTTVKDEQSRYYNKIKRNKEKISILSVAMEFANDKKLKKIFKNAITIEKYRMKFFKTHNIKWWAKILMYPSYIYEIGLRSYLGDLILMVKNKM